MEHVGTLPVQQHLIDLDHAAEVAGAKFNTTLMPESGT